MNVYLTVDQFAKLFWKLYSNSTAKSEKLLISDQILKNIFYDYQEDVIEALKLAVDGIEEFSGTAAIDLIGFQFHKSFRQWEPIEVKHISWIAWTCMQEAPVFWKALTSACEIFTNTEALALCEVNDLL